MIETNITLPYGAYSAPEAELICLAQETSFLDSKISDLPGNPIVDEPDEE